MIYYYNLMKIKIKIVKNLNLKILMEQNMFVLYMMIEVLNYLKLLDMMNIHLNILMHLNLMLKLQVTIDMY